MQLESHYLWRLQLIVPYNIEESEYYKGLVILWKFYNSKKKCIKSGQLYWFKLRT